MITVRLPEPLRDGRGAVMTIDAASLGDIIARLDLADDRDELFNFAVNGELVAPRRERRRLKENGDEVEIVVAFSGG